MGAAVGFADHDEKSDAASLAALAFVRNPALREALADAGRLQFLIDRYTDAYGGIEFYAPVDWHSEGVRATIDNAMRIVADSALAGRGGGSA